MTSAVLKTGGKIGSSLRIAKLFLGLPAALGLAVLVSVAPIEPAAAQLQSDGYQFLKSVRDRDGDVATKMLSEPGSQIVNTRDITTGETGLHIVAARRDTLWIRFLLQRGGDPNVRDRKGATPLQIAVRLNHIDGVEALIKGGAQVDISDRQGETPLMTAVHQRNVELVRTLLDKGADPDVNDNTGRSARDHMERMTGNTLIARVFEEADKERDAKPKAQQYGPSF